MSKSAGDLPSKLVVAGLISRYEAEQRKAFGFSGWMQSEEGFCIFLFTVMETRRLFKLNRKLFCLESFPESTVHICPASSSWGVWSGGLHLHGELSV